MRAYRWESFYRGAFYRGSVSNNQLSPRRRMMRPISMSTGHNPPQQRKRPANRRPSPSGSTDRMIAASVGNSRPRPSLCSDLRCESRLCLAIVTWDNDRAKVAGISPWPAAINSAPSDTASLGPNGIGNRIFQVDGFSASSEDRYPKSDFDVVGMLPYDSLIGYTSSFYSGEINFRRQYADWLTLLAGFRMGQLNEASDMGLLMDESLGIHTVNHLYGFQLGADAEVYNAGGPLSIRFIGKAGVYGNAAEQHSELTISETEVISYSAHRTQAAFLGEAGIVATYALTNHLALHASLKGVWLNEMAPAPEQNFLLAVNTSGTVSYYGGGLGLEYRF